MGLKGPFNEQFLLRLDPEYRKGRKDLRTFAEASAQGQAALEREEQRLFSRELQRRELPFYWHSTAHRTKATVGCPDFIVGINAVTIWIEFKMHGGRLSEDQLAFAARLGTQHCRYHLVFSCKEAIELLNAYAI
jgi:hypothetical protein